MNNIVKIQNGEIRLYSGLNEQAFGKTNYFNLIGEKGFAFNCSSQEWSFDNIRTDDSLENPTVYYCGKNPFSNNAETLYSIFESAENAGNDNTEIFNAVSLVVKAMTYGAKNNIEIPATGAGGIIVDTTEEKVLFLPQKLFKCSSAILAPEDYFNLETGWLNDTLTGTASICYERAVIVYRLLTAQFPFTEIDDAKRNADILDKNYLPIELCIPEINEQFAKELSRALRLTTTMKVGSDDLAVHQDFNIDQLKDAWTLKLNSNLTPQVIAEKTSAYLKNKKLKINAKRNLRRNTAAIIAVICVIIAITIFTVSTTKRQNQQYTARGKTSIELIQNFFYGVNKKNTSLMDAIVDGSGPDEYVRKITDVYIMEKQITGFTRETGFLTPEQWILASTTKERFKIAKVFGITNLKIDGKIYEPEKSLYRRNDYPQAVETENNKILENEDITNHKVEYYLLQTDLENDNIIVEKVTDLQTFTYTNDRWLLTDISSETENLNVNTEQFVNDYLYELENYDNNVVAACQSLKNKYEWIPTIDSIILEQQNYQ